MDDRTRKDKDMNELGDPFIFVLKTYAQIILGLIGIGSYCVLVAVFFTAIGMG